ILIQSQPNADYARRARRTTMKVLPISGIFAVVIAATTSCAAGQQPAPANVAGTTCPAFPANSWWHADVSRLPIHPRSDQWMSHMSPTRDLHPDFGNSYGEQPAPYGIPITVVSSAHDRVRVHFDYASESDQVHYPLG